MAVETIDIYELMERAYLGSGEKSVHALSVYLEKQVRFAACIAVSILAASGDLRVPLPRKGGLGSHLSHIKKVADNCDNTASYPEISELLSALVESLNSPQENQEPGISLKRYRDFLAHGGLEPAGEALRKALNEAIEFNAEAITECINSLGGVTRFDSQYYIGNSIPLGPLFIEIDGGFSMFHDLSGSKAIFYTLDPTRPLREVEDVSKLADLGKILAEPAGTDEESRQVSRFQGTVRSDLQGFVESGETISIIGEYSPFNVEWSRKLSDGSEYRSDTFKLDRNGTRLWFDGARWSEYSSFLKSISNWSVVVARSLARLVELDKNALAANENQFKYESSFVLPANVKTRFSIKDLIGATFDSKRDLDDVDLESQIDESATSINGAPQIFFVTGEAGIGKTHNLLQASLRRAHSVSSNGLSQPLYLYISCSGVGLKKVDELIDAAVVGTRNLDYKSVLALCRAGLIVLVIDGFDELLGGAGYRDAFQLLAPTLNQLGSRGTLLLSARSSYFANQYQASIEAARGVHPISVHHMVLELQRWRRSDVDQLFDANKCWAIFRARLSDSDRELLGVPFFARAFNDYVMGGAGADSFNGLRSVLIDAYLDREVAKMEGSGSANLVTKTQLRAIFEEVAGMMHESLISFLDLEDFKFACATALELEDFTGKRSALWDRLTVLCGISATAVDGAAPLFAFQHDIFYEVLLADYLASNYLGKQASYASMTEVLSKAVLGDATVQSLIGGYAEVVGQFLKVMSVLPPHAGTVLSSNIAALTAAYISARKVIPGVLFQGVVFDSVELADMRPFSVRFTDCRFERLVLEAGSIENLWLDSCEVQHLAIVGDGVLPLAGVELSGKSKVLEISRVSDQGQEGFFADSQISVLEGLRSLGATGFDEQLTAAENSQPSELEIFAERVLTKFSSRRNSYVIEARTRVPGAGASAWIRDPHNAAWADLTDALERAELVTVRVLNASGASKLTVTFVAPPWDVVDRESDSDRIQRFWADVHDRR
ncbi:hypothetical protein ACFC06_14315 [Nocardia sp. NPDC056064]|uniref:hypothetical protein n=1 Tax=Nocardia sp. NPDC056064 TaxID=3345701 RepID=UPI0035DC96AA